MVCSLNRAGSQEAKLKMSLHSNENILICKFTNIKDDNDTKLGEQIEHLAICAMESLFVQRLSSEGKLSININFFILSIVIIYEHK